MFNTPEQDEAALQIALVALEAISTGANPIETAIKALDQIKEECGEWIIG